MKRLIVLVLTFCLILSSAVCVSAADYEQICADTLYKLGLFNGTGTKADGSPDFALNVAPTRQVAVTMLVRLLGKDSEAKNGAWNIPFDDVDDWAKPYVGYAYNNGLANGISDTKFGANSNITAPQYLTFVLRALGYSSSTDFQWDKSDVLAAKLGICDEGEFNNTAFLRGDVADISLMTLLTEKKDSTKTLADALVDQGVISKNTYSSALTSMMDMLEAAKSAPTQTQVVTEQKTETPVQQPAAPQQTQKSEEPASAKQETSTPAKQNSSSSASSGTSTEYTYVLNKNTKKFHKPGCSSINQMKESNKIFFNGTAEEAESQGYVKCSKCF